MHSNHLLLEEPIRMASILEPSKAIFFPTMTKIVGTLGPRSRSVEVISGCLKSGMSAFNACRRPPNMVRTMLLISASFTSTTASSPSTLVGLKWHPFNGSRGTMLMGILDLEFRIGYLIGYLLAPYAAMKHPCLILLLSIVGANLFTRLLRSAYWLKVHSFLFSLLVQFYCILVQAIGWTSVSKVVQNWFRNTQKRLIMCAWQCHSSFGNIIGLTITLGVINLGWGWCFVLPVVMILLVGFMVFMYLAICPEDMLKLGRNANPVEPPLEPTLVRFCDAIRFLVTWYFNVSIFCSNVVAFTFHYWLPFYVKITLVRRVFLSHRATGAHSIFFDVEVVVGAILILCLSHVVQVYALTSIPFLLLAILALIGYLFYGSASSVVTISLLFFCGMMVNSPYVSITSPIVVKLGTLGRASLEMWATLFPKSCFPSNIT